MAQAMEGIVNLAVIREAELPVQLGEITVFYLWDDADCTDLIKVIEDGIFPALGINDSWALPRAISKEIGPKSEARVEVTIT